MVGEKFVFAAAFPLRSWRVLLRNKMFGNMVSYSREKGKRNRFFRQNSILYQLSETSEKWIAILYML